MGGPGSGRVGGRPRKITVEECPTLSVFDLHRHGVLEMRPGPHASGRIAWPCGSIGFRLEGSPDKDLSIWLTYTLTRDGVIEDLDYPVSLQTTSPHFGGVRYWLTCPLVRDRVPCRRRVGKLYLPPRARYFGCRKCYELTYRSSQERRTRVEFYRRHPKALEAMFRKSTSGSDEEMIQALGITGKLQRG